MALQAETRSLQHLQRAQIVVLVLSLFMTAVTG